MYKYLNIKLQQLLNAPAPATGIGLFRLLYGLVTLQEIVFLLYFKHLIFDPVPYIDIEFPMIGFFLVLWGLVSCCLILGYRSQLASIINYVFWIVFVQFTPMQRDFDGGFDVFMTGLGFFLMFMPIDQVFSLDTLRKKLRQPFVHYSQYAAPVISKAAYVIPVSICLGFLYFDSGIHKLFAQHWRNGLGSWLPATQPYYVSALDFSALLDNELLVKSVGYTILVFQFTFVFFAQQRWLRPVYLLIGAGLHIGIIVTLNIYPFGFGMLICYVLLVPFAWWRLIAGYMQCKHASLTVFYDERCPLCNRTVLILNHFDIFKTVDFKGAQSNRNQYPALTQVSEQQLLKDLYTLDAQGQLHSGVNAYAQILMHMRYCWMVGKLLTLPGIYTIACKLYRHIADNRQRLDCNEQCDVTPRVVIKPSVYEQLIGRYQQHPKRFCFALSKFLLIILALQLNSSVHYGLLYRLHVDTRSNEISSTLTDMSNNALLVSQMLFGITPHALYVHDHFEGYDHIIALTYTDANGIEQWLPFVNQQGRMLAPNWGRVHSMWANVAVTTKIDQARLSKFIMKVTAFWGANLGLDINQTQFHIKLKKINAPNTWVVAQLHKNLSGDWQTIGSAQWHDNHFSISVPNNINDL